MDGQIIGIRVLVFMAVGMAFSAGYLVRGLPEANQVAGQVKDETINSGLDSLHNPVSMRDKSPTSLRLVTNAALAAQASSSTRPAVVGAIPPQATQAEAAVAPATAMAPDPDEARRVRQGAVDAFVSGTHLREIMASEAFGRLTEQDQELAIGDMVQLVNDGLVSDELIYGP